ncbi:MAG: hypothetical protein K6G61_01750 [Solobacterium sp.]|nr:hypothetical protein [Solobacterium sp.]
MTTVITKKKKCAVCGHEHDYVMIASTNAFGPSDLDTRPPQMARSTMRYWVEECPACGYASDDISSPAGVPSSFLQSEPYRTYDGIGFQSRLAGKFYRQYMIQSELDDAEEAFWSVLHCAWACDDYEDTDNAKRCREEAVRLADRLLLTDSEDRDDLMVMRADLLRRSGHFDHVIHDYAQYRTDDETFNAILRFQIRKAAEQDDGCYVTDDALQYEEDS